MRQTLQQNAAAILLQNATKVYYKKVFGIGAKLVSGWEQNMLYTKS